MDLTNLLADDDAVSPVIGVILMVAITVILAAVIGTFVLGLQDRIGPTGPSASLSFEFDDGGDGWGNSNDNITITHESGEKLDVETINGTVGGETITGVNATTWAADITAGDSMTISEGQYGPSPNARAYVSGIAEGDGVRVIWTNPEGSQTQTLAEGEVT